MAAEASPLPEEIHAIYCGGIDQANAQKVVNSLTFAMGGKVKHIHFLFQSAGGYVGDGVFLYNLFRSIPIETTLYNVGQISSAGVVAYLGATHRKTTRNATFMMQHHDVYVSGEEAVNFGIADEIGEFSPPAGQQVYNLLRPMSVICQEPNSARCTEDGAIYVPNVWIAAGFKPARASAYVSRAPAAI
jgi:ATP-dependent protease ClpP protease subunit